MSRKRRKPATSRSKRQDLNIAGSSRFIVGDNASIFLPLREPLIWPVRVGQPPRLAAAFQPRGILLQTLSDFPLTERPAPGREFTDGHSLVLFGEAGAGKSQIAAAYFYEAQQRGTELVIWVPATSRSQILDAYVEARIRIDSSSLDIVRDSERLAVGLLDWLATTRRTWLVVLDDVTEAVDIRGLWPSGPTGTVVMTTKRRDLRPTDAIAREVGMFTREESVNYLTERLTEAAKNDLLDDPGGIAEDLQNRPVALAQAAAYLLAENLTCHEYRARFAEAGRRLEDLLPSHTPADEYPHTTSRAAILALDAANRLPPSGLAKPALCLAAVLDPAGAPTALWDTDAARAYLSTHREVDPPGTECRSKTSRGIPLAGRKRPSIVRADDVRTALQNLDRLSLISHTRDSPSAQNVEIHALTQRAVVDMLPSADLAPLILSASLALLSIWPVEVEDPSVAAALRRNSAAIARVHVNSEWSLTDVQHHDPKIELLGRIIRLAERAYFPRRSRRGLAKSWLAHHATEEQHADPQSPVRLGNRSALADARGALGDIRAAISGLRDALAEQIRILGKDNPVTLRTRGSLAYWLKETGDLSGAARQLEEALAELSTATGRDSRQTLLVRHNLALIRAEAGHPKEALKELRSVLAARVRLFGAEDRATLGARYSLAYWNGESGDTRGAIAEYRRLLSDGRRILGDDDPLTMAARNELAFCCGKRGDTAGAIAELNQLLEDQRRFLGHDHTDTFITRFNIAGYRAKMDDVSAALAEFQSLLADQRRVLGHLHPETVSTRKAVDYWRRRIR